MFLKNTYVKKKENALYLEFFIFSNVFVWATGGRAMESSWHIQSIYPISAAGRYLPQSWHLPKLTMLFENRIFRHVWLEIDLSWSHKFPNPQLNFKKCRYKAYFGTCTTFSASRLFRRFSMSARSGSTRYHNALPNKISSDWTS